MRHAAINRTLSTIALVLGIIIMLATIIGGIAFIVKANQVSNSISDIGDSIDDTPLPSEANCDYEGGPDCVEGGN